MTRADLIADWQRRKAEALETGTTAPVAKLADVVLRQLEELDGHGTQLGGNGAEPDQLVGIDKAAEILGVKRRYLYDYSRDLPFVRRIGRQLRFSVRGMQRWVARR